jgi:carboxylesterase type B
MAGESELERGRVVRMSAGAVRGVRQNELTVFRGIPFAAAPEGALRFAAPAPPQPWDGVREATAFGVAPPQSPAASGLAPSWRPADGLDCLTVNVWTPEIGAVALPVMVWIYGGAWIIGGAGMPGYDPSLLANCGVVVVTFNYRVGFEGFGQLPGAPANRGLQDQVAALTWVRDNIGAFGGDPCQVTVFGESAGAGSVVLMMGTAAGAGLFRRGIAQSVPGGVLTVAEATKVTGIMAEAAGVPPTLEAFAALPPEAVLRAQDAMLRQSRGGLPLGPIADGDLVAGQPWEVVRSSYGREVDLICGFMHEEFRAFLPGSPIAPGPGGIDPASVDLGAAAAILGLLPDAADSYRTAYPGSRNADLFMLMMSDALFRMPSTWVAEAHAAGGGRTWLYDFTWRSPVLGACHGLDVLFTFGDVTTALASSLLGSPPSAAVAPLSAALRTAWTSFAVNGDPGWPRFEPDGGTTRIWDAPPADVAYPLDASRRIWEQLVPR